MPGKSHPLLTVVTWYLREASRIHARLVVGAGAYVLQTNRATYNQGDCHDICLLCGEDDDDETLSHFLLWCSALEETRCPILQDVLNARDDVKQHIGPAHWN